MSWTSRRHWRAARRHYLHGQVAREISLEIIRAHQQRENRFRLDYLDAWLSDEKRRLHPRVFAAATRPLMRYLCAAIIVPGEQLAARMAAR
jgi:hypothetical protein